MYSMLNKIIIVKPSTLNLHKLQQKIGKKAVNIKEDLVCA